MIVVIHAHPYPSRSRACRALVEAIRTLPQVEVRSLYDRYPDFDIDIPDEQRALERAQLLVWMHPLYWYSMPSLLKHWIDTVLQRGWAYGEGGTALAGKHCLWVATAGGDASSYAEGRTYRKPFERFMDPVEQTARFCGMEWEPPQIVFGSRTISEAALAEQAATLRRRLAGFAAAHPVDALAASRADVAAEARPAIGAAMTAGAVPAAGAAP
jgi:glutathione-regulated potassium-efflux system ancillary protein KefF